MNTASRLYKNRTDKELCPENVKRYKQLENSSVACFAQIFKKMIDHIRIICWFSMKLIKLSSTKIYQTKPRNQDFADAQIDYFTQVWSLHQLVSKEKQFCF